MLCDIDVGGTGQNLQKWSYVNTNNNGLAKVANAELVDENGNAIRVSFWEEDIKKIKNGLKILLTKGITKIFKGKPSLYKSTQGTIEVLDFNPDVTFYDIAKFLKYKKHIQTFEEYYEYIKSLNSEVYLGTEKINYLEILDAFLIIKLAREKATKQNSAEENSIYFLHQQVGMSTKMIIKIIRLYEIEMTNEIILRL